MQAIELIGGGFRKVINYTCKIYAKESDTSTVY